MRINSTIIKFFNKNIKFIFKKIHVNTDKELLCNASFTSLFLGIDGFVYPCCINQRYKLGNFREKNLNEIWDSAEINSFRNTIIENNFPYGCEICKNAVINKNKNAFLKNYSNLKANGKIQRLDFQISNICNLACDMCTGQLSSQVSIQKENFISKVIRPINQIEFYEILQNLKEAYFSGGESFLIKSYYDIWDFLIKNNKTCKIYIQTNGTVYNDDISNLITQGDFRISFSIDSLEKSTYEKIRLNAIFENTINNVLEIRKKIGSDKITFTTCILRDNYAEIPKIIEYCNDNNILLYFNTVIFPAKNAIWPLHSSIIKEIIELFQSSITKTESFTQKNNYQEFSSQINTLIDWYHKSIHYEETILTEINSKNIDLLKEKIINRISLESSTRKGSDSSNTQIKINSFEKILNSIPNTLNKLNSLYVIDNYSSDSLVSHLYREDKDSLTVLLSKLSIFYNVK